MKKTILRSALLAVVGVGLMAGGAMATVASYGQNGFMEDYEFYQMDTGAGDWQYVSEGDSYSFFFDMAILNDPWTYAAPPLDVEPTGTNSDLSLMNDVVGYGDPVLSPGYTPIADVWASMTIYSVDSEWESFDATITAYYGSGYVENIAVSDVNLGPNGTNYQTFTMQFSDALLDAWIVDPYGDIEIALNFNNGGAANDFGLVEVGMGIAPVPEPATMLLFGTGLIGLAGLSRRNRKKA